MKNLPAITQLTNSGEGRTVWLYDVKSYNDRLTLKNAPRFWRSAPPLEESHFQSCMEAVFNAKKESNFFRANDMLIVLDGRRSGSSDRISRVLGKVMKGHSDFNKRPCGSPLRLFYSNQELLNRTIGAFFNAQQFLQNRFVFIAMPLHRSGHKVH